MSPKDTDHGDEHGVVLLDTYAPGDRAQGTALVTAGRPGLGAVVVAVIALAALWLALGGDEPAPGAQPASTPPPTTSPPALAPLPTLSQQTRSEWALTVAITSHQGEAGRVLQWAPQQSAPVVDEGFDLRQPRFDASGRWVAGLGVAPGSGGGLVLWAGPVGEPLEPVEVGVRGFAWHDTRAGGLAWTAPSPSGGASLVIVNLSSPGPHRRARFVDSDDRLGHWGDWGAALSSLNRPYRTTVLDGRADVVATAGPGLAVGWTPGWGVATSGRGSTDGVTTFTDGAWTSPPWARPGEQALDVAVSPHGDRAAVHLVRSDRVLGGDEGRIVVLDGQTVVGELGGVARWAAMTWSPDGRTLALARQGGGSGTELVWWDPATGAEAALTVPGLDPNRDWVEAIALTDGRAVAVSSGGR